MQVVDLGRVLWDYLRIGTPPDGRPSPCSQKRISFRRIAIERAVNAAKRQLVELGIANHLISRVGD